MTVEKKVCRDIGLAMIHSYGAMLEILLYLRPMRVLLFQALNRFMYRVGVPRCSYPTKLSLNDYIFTLDNKK